MSDSWGEDTEGASAQHPDLNTSQFKSPPVSKDIGKNLSVEDHARRVNRIIDTYNAATPGQQKQGNRWYPVGHRAAVTVAKGEAPGIVPEGKVDTPAIRRGVYHGPNVSHGDIDRSSGEIASLSPSMPAGMDWEHNPQAAHELNQLPDSQVERLSKVGNRAKTLSLSHAGSDSIKTAASIKYGQSNAEALEKERVLKSGGTTTTPKKRGAFADNLSDPAHSTRTTVDARSAGISAGRRLKFDEVAPVVGKLEGQRYTDFEAANTEATDIINQHLKASGSSRVLKPHQVQATTWIADKQGQEFGQANHATGRGRLDYPRPVGQERSG